MANKKCILVGGEGQDGFFMSKMLNAKGYSVFIVNKENVHLLHDIIEEIKPGEIYNFAGLSNVISPYENLDAIFDVNAKLPHKILESIVKINKGIKFFQASSSLIFGRDKSGFQNEQTSFNPIYPYGAAKLYAQNIVREYREAFGVFACSGILFNHESERRGDHFFSRKVCKAAAIKTKVNVGSLSAYRDYGYAPDYVEAAHLMLHANTPKDYVIGTGVLTSLTDFAKKAFGYVGLDYKDYVICDETLVRPNDTNILRADIAAIKNDLGWEPKTNINELIKKIIEHDQRVI